MDRDIHQLRSVDLSVRAFSLRQLVPVYLEVYHANVLSCQMLLEVIANKKAHETFVELGLTRFGQKNVDSQQRPQNCGIFI